MKLLPNKIRTILMNKLTNKNIEIENTSITENGPCIKYTDQNGETRHTNPNCPQQNQHTH